MNWRFEATIARLIGNIPAACKALQEKGHANLAGQLQRDRDNLVHWQEHDNPNIALCPHCTKDVLSTQPNYFCPYCGERCYPTKDGEALRCPDCEAIVEFADAREKPGP